MRSSILILVLFSISSAFVAGCASTAQALAFEPRSYPYVPELGLDGPNAANGPNASIASK
jgi:hypothetical protein